MKTHPVFGTQKNSGLTLIELLIVIAIIAILTLIGLMSWRSQFNKAKDAARKDDLQKLSIALENYFNDNDCYPIAGILDNCGGDELSPYLAPIPCDPVTNTKYCYIPDDTLPGTCPRYYRLLSSLDYTNDPIIAKLQCHGDDYCGYESICATLEQAGYNYGVSSLNVPVLNPLTSPPPSAPPSPGASPEPGTYACDPAGECNSYADTSTCGRTWSDINLCNAYCPTSAPEERCAY